MADFAAGIEYIIPVTWATPPPTFAAGIEYVIPVTYGGGANATPDIVDPIVSNVVPASPSAVARGATISFWATDPVAPKTGVQVVTVFAIFADVAELVFDGTAFDARYSGTISAIPDGFSVSLSRISGWHRAAFTIRVVATDGGGNTATVDLAYTVTPNPDVLPSVAFVPASGTRAPSDTVAVDVTEIEGAVGLATVRLDIIYDGGVAQRVELARDASAGSGTGVAPYTVGISAIANGYRYTVAKVGGWDDDFSIRARVVDRDGNFVVTTSSEYVRDPVALGPDTTPPVIGNLSPAPGTTIASTDALSFDVTDNRGTFRRVIVAVYFPTTGITEMVHDGDVFVGYFVGSSSRVVIAGGFRYTILRSGGWIGSPTVRIFPIDLSGNET